MSRTDRTGATAKPARRKEIERMEVISKDVRGETDEGKRHDNSRPTTHKSATRRAALANTSQNPARSTTKATSKAPVETTRKRKRSDTEMTECLLCSHIETLCCANCKKIISNAKLISESRQISESRKVNNSKRGSDKAKINDLLSSSKSDVKTSKVTRDEIPSTTQSTSQLVSSTPSPRARTPTPPPPAKRRKMVRTVEDSPAGLSSSSSSQHSPWRPLIPPGFVRIVHREW